MSETLCYFQSGIGNLILATPAMQAMAALDPSGKIDILLNPGYQKDSRFGAIREIFEYAPFVRQTVYFGEQNGNYRRFFVPVQSETSAAGHWANRKTPVKGAWPGSRWAIDPTHEIEVNMKYARHHGYKGPTPKPFAPVADWPVLSGPRPWIGICNSSFGTLVWEKKRWEWFPELAAGLLSEYGGTMFGVGGRGDLAEVPGIANFSGRTSIAETGKILSQLDLFVTTDTGCMHIADALDVPLISLFGPTITNKNAPVGKRSYFMKSAILCAPCQYTARFSTCRNYLCMRLITPDDVAETIRELKLLTVESG